MLQIFIYLLSMGVVSYIPGASDNFHFACVSFMLVSVRIV